MTDGQQMNINPTTQCAPRSTDRGVVGWVGDRSCQITADKNYRQTRFLSNDNILLKHLSDIFQAQVILAIRKGK